MKKRRTRRTVPGGSRKGSKDKTPEVREAGYDDLPLYCDFSCPKADFPPADAVGACRREQAVWCKLLKEFNTKNGRCKVRNQKP